MHCESVKTNSAYMYMYSVLVTITSYIVGPSKDTACLCTVDIYSYSYTSYFFTE